MGRLAGAILFALLAAPAFATQPLPSQATGMVLFEQGSSSLPERVLLPLCRVASLAKAPYDGRIVLGGHTDRTEDSIELSNARAAVVRAKLIELGIAPERISIELFAARKPMDDALQSRRVEIDLVRSCAPTCPEIFSLPPDRCG